MLSVTKRMLSTLLLANMMCLPMYAMVEESDVVETVVEESDIVEEVTNVAPVDLEAFKAEAMHLGQAACFFSTHGSEPYFKVIETDIDETKIIKCGCTDPVTGKRRYIKDVKDLETIAPLRYTIQGFGGNYKYDIKYHGERETVLGGIIAKVVLPNEDYEGKIFIDEYKKNIPMFWVLKDAAEFKAIANYMLKTFAEEGFITNSKTLLVLKLRGDAKLETLDDADKAFLNTYFELFPLTDEDTKEFFESAKEWMLEQGHHLHKPKIVGESTRYGIMRQIDKHYDEFEVKKAVILFGGIVATTFIADLFKDEIKAGYNKIKKNIFKIKEDTLTEWLWNKYAAQYFATEKKEA